MKKLVLSLFLVLVVGAVNAQGNRAYFHDNRTWMPSDFLRYGPTGDPDPRTGMTYEEYRRYQEIERSLAILETIERSPDLRRARELLIRRQLQGLSVPQEAAPSQDPRPSQDERPAQ